MYDITEADRKKLRELCELQEKYLEKVPKTIRDTDFSTYVGVALQCNMDILREVACRLGHGFYPHAPYIMEKHECVKNYLERAGIIIEKEGKGPLGIFPKGPIRRMLEDRRSTKISWQKLSIEDQILLSDIHRVLREQVGPAIFRISNPLYRIALDDAIGIMYGLSNPEEFRRDTIYIREKLGSVEYRLKAMEKGSMVR